MILLSRRHVTQNTKKICRVGCGEEKNAGMGDTPGWKIRDTDFIEVDKNRGIKLLRLKRSESRMKQTSFTMLQSWRANCDISLLIYTQDPMKLNEKDIAAISGYVTSYCTKGNATQPAAVDAVSSMILSMKNEFAEGPKTGTVTAARKILNGFMTDRIISKAESSCDILKLPLYKCTEQFRTIPLNQYQKIIGNSSKQQRQNRSNNIVAQYSARTEQMNMNLNDYFYMKNISSSPTAQDAKRLLKLNFKSKQVIAHPTGLQNSPSYPIKWQYAKAALLLYKPWHRTKRLSCDVIQSKHETNENIVHEYYNFLKESNCPDELKLEFAIAKETFDRSVKNRLCAQNVDNIDNGTGEDMTEETKQLLEAQRIFRNQFERHGLDMGLDYAWDKPYTHHDPLLNDTNWIDLKKEEWESCRCNQKNIPTKKNKMNYTLEDIDNNPEQINVVYAVIAKIKEWIEFEQTKSHNPLVTFKPLYLTIQGAGGTGKSRTINVIITIIEGLFPNEKVSIVSAPTGASAYNIGGSTCHKQFGLHVQNLTKDLSDATKMDLCAKLKHILVLIIDERSLLSMEVLGACERNTRQCCHGGLNTNSPWGKIPVVLLFGDDYQLPSVVVNNRGKGSSYVLENDEIPHKRQRFNDIEFLGSEQFITLSEKVTELKTSHRLEQGEHELSSMLHTMRTADGLTPTQASSLLTFNIQNTQISLQRKQFLKQNAIWIFHSNAKVDEHNMNMMKTVVNHDNPVCNCMGNFSPASKEPKKVANRRHFKFTELKKINSTLARGARVALDRNLWDHMGLYNGAMGTVIDIRFDTDKSPLRNDLPAYVIVDFDDYNGPSWDADNPSFLPIPPCSIMCQHKCCVFTKLPLTLSWARTTHKFQGSNVGPTHFIKAMVFDPGNAAVEGGNPGFTYVGLSRVSTLGKGDINKSAFYLSGDNLTSERFTNLTYQRTRNNDIYVKLRAKRKWIEHLNSRKEKTNLAINPSTKQFLHTWVKTTTYDTIALESAILFHSKN